MIFLLLLFYKCRQIFTCRGIVKRTQLLFFFLSFFFLLLFFLFYLVASMRPHLACGLTFCDCPASWLGRRTGECRSPGFRMAAVLLQNRIKVIVTANGLIFAARCHIYVALTRSHTHTLSLSGSRSLSLGIFIKKLKSTACGYAWVEEGQQQ